MPYKLGAVKPHVQAAADTLGPMFGFTNIGGYRAVGSVPNSDHPKGLALDFMTFNKAKGDRLKDYALANAGSLGVKYVIWWGRIYFPDGESRTYHGPSPHMDHVHISFNAEPGSGGETVTPVGNPLDPSNWPIIGELEGISTTLQDAEFWKRVGTYALGAAMVGAGLLFVLRKPIGTAIEVVK